MRIRLRSAGGSQPGPGESARGEESTGSAGARSDNPASRLQLVYHYVDRAVLEYGANPLCTQLLRRLASEWPTQFAAAALRHLDSDGDTSAQRLLAGIMLRQPTLYEMLTNPAQGTRERSVKIFRKLMKFDPSLDVKLARKLPDRTGINHGDAFDARRSARALDVLDETSRGRRLLPILGHLVSSRDARMAAKATLFVGKRLQSPAWAEKQLKHEDARIRANAIESLWGLDTDAAKNLLVNCASDDCNRVVGNALVGLHLVGEPGVMDEVKSMASLGKPQFRSTAAWSMGQIGDPEFLPGLKGLLRDDDPMVRGTALRALVQIRQVEDRMPEAILDRTEKLSEVEIESVVAASTAALERDIVIPDINLNGSSFQSGYRTVRIA